MPKRPLMLLLPFLVNRGYAGTLLTDLLVRWSSFLEILSISLESGFCDSEKEATAIVNDIFRETGGEFLQPWHVEYLMARVREVCENSINLEPEK